MRLREPFVKKHVHTWQSATVDPGEPVYDAWGFEVAKNNDELARVCVDCGCKQSAKMTAEGLDGIPKSLWHLADLEWK